MSLSPESISFRSEDDIEDSDEEILRSTAPPRESRPKRCVAKKKVQYVYEECEDDFIDSESSFEAEAYSDLDESWD